MDGAGRAKAAPCESACPAGIDVPRTIRHIRHGQFREALEVIRERIPFPLVCGYACYHPCETKCARSQFDAPLAIRQLKRAAAEHGLDGVRPAVARERTGKRVGIVGSGPCGLTAAYFLALLGHEVTVYEERAKAGGMVRHGIPAYRLPDDVLERDLRAIVDSGVTIRTGTRIEAVECLVEQGFDAALVACGAWRGARLGIAGEERANVIDGLSFLAAVNSGNAPALRGARVIVVGGGNTAIDAARVGRRLGADVVQIYRRTRADMPANAEEIAAAVEEGVEFKFLTAPVSVEDTALRSIRMAPGPPDASGRPRPQPIAGSEHDLAADSIIVAVGQRVEVPARSVACGSNGTIAADPESLSTSNPRIFAGGDAVSGPASIIDAIADGRRAASAIDRLLGGDGDLGIFASPRQAVEAGEAAPRGSRCEEPSMLALPERLRGFALVEQTYERPSAMAEAGRCLSCDLFAFDVRVNGERCKGCGYCAAVCRLGVFHRTDGFNAGGYHPYRADGSAACVGCLECLYVCPDFAVAVGAAEVDPGSCTTKSVWHYRSGD